ncbi:MAG: hypothetical protein H7Z14_06470 [Anaerolineae bacterium]|nr:hypothetical protein [Phycisphaerae bacterium]
MTEAATETSRIDLKELSRDACYRCDYDLTGIANDQACPECGLLAERSRRVTDELHDTRPKWLSRLSLGAKLLMAGLILGSVWPITIDFIQQQIYAFIVASGRTPWWLSPFGYDIIPWAGFDFAVILFVVGIWFLTGRERYGPADDDDRARRNALRVASLAPLVAVLILHITVWWITRNLFRRPRLTSEATALWAIFWTLISCASIVVPLLLFRQLRSLAVRAHSAHLAEHCSIVGIGGSGSLVFLLFVLLSFAYPQQLGLPKDWSIRSNPALIALLTGKVGSVLFLLWSLYLLIRFTISFHFAAKALHLKWNRDDRSIAI